MEIFLGMLMFYVMGIRLADAIGFVEYSGQIDMAG
jgi:hypothetical protein